MKKFFTYLLATITGVILVNLFFFILFFAIIAGIGSMSFQKASVAIKSNSILELSFDETITDRESGNPLETFDPFSFSHHSTLGLNTLLKKINAAASDDRISGIYLNLQDIDGGLSTVEEVRAALLEFKKSGKFIYSYSNLGYSQTSYYLATTADSLFINPNASLLLTGLSATVAYYKDMLQKFGVSPEVVRVGKFKSAVEPFLDNKMSEANREQLSVYLNSRWANIVKGIADGRKIPAERVNRLTDEFRFYSPEEFVKEGLFDAAIWEDQMVQKLKTACNVEEEEELNLVSIADYSQVTWPDKNVKNHKIAVIYALGEIGMKQATFSIGPELALTIREARRDTTVKAIVLRVNSPGGSASTSDIIWREVELAARVKPVIASMGNVAASGGYYIACAADTIIADPTTITGSIGVFGIFFSGEKLIRETIGIHPEVVTTHRHGDFGGSYPLPLPLASRGLTPYERQVLQMYVNNTYTTFLDRVSQGRGMTPEAVNEIGQGRVWTGEDALRIGLVDMLGGLEQAIALAAEKAGLTTYQLQELPAAVNFWQILLEEFPAAVKQRVVKAELGELYPLYEQQKRLLTTRGILARLPVEFSL
ncbi:MAG: signal peptide peptidase SppA [Odoribacteraceae bacterium]|jgi:protease-4|nr:signal peptide peptidase SppA [Odoribacteraceae bacterium]